jgi:hypothetical protein
MDITRRLIFLAISPPARLQHNDRNWTWRIGNILGVVGAVVVLQA